MNLLVFHLAVCFKGRQPRSGSLPIELKLLHLHYLFILNKFCVWKFSYPMLDSPLCLHDIMLEIILKIVLGLKGDFYAFHDYCCFLLHSRLSENGYL